LSHFCLNNNLSQLANLSKESFDEGKLPTNALGVYYGFAKVGRDRNVEPMVMSIGWNPFFQNKEKSVEVHILKKFENDFYGEEIKVIAIGFIREMTSFSSLDELIKAIENDIRFGKEQLGKPENLKFTTHSFWTN